MVFTRCGLRRMTCDVDAFRAGRLHIARVQLQHDIGTGVVGRTSHGRAPSVSLNMSASLWKPTRMPEGLRLSEICLI